MCAASLSQILIYSIKHGRLAVGMYPVKSFNANLVDTERSCSIYIQTIPITRQVIIHCRSISFVTPLSSPGIALYSSRWMVTMQQSGFPPLKTLGARIMGLDPPRKIQAVYYRIVGSSGKMSSVYVLITYRRLYTTTHYIAVVRVHVKKFTV